MQLSNTSQANRSRQKNNGNPWHQYIFDECMSIGMLDMYMDVKEMFDTYCEEGDRPGRAAYRALFELGMDDFFEKDTIDVRAH